MTFDRDRLRAGEWLIGIGALLLAVDLFALPWYGLTSVFAPGAAQLGQPTTTTGWGGLLVIGPLALLVALLGLAVCWLQGTRPAPALPVACTLIELALGTLLAVCLVVRVLFAPPGILIPGAPGVRAVQTLYGGYAGLLLSIVILAGAYLSLRRDGIAERDAPRRVEVLRLARRA